MTCNIEWNTLSIPEWEARFAQIHRANLLQSYAYARIVCPARGQKGRWGLIRIDGREAGLVQILEAGLFGNRLHALVLDRGPLWLDGFGTAEHMRQFLFALNREFPRHLLRRRRFIPEIASDPQALQILADAGFTRQKAKTYETHWLDLRRNEAALRVSMKKRWRNSLNKAEKAGLTLEWDEEGIFVDWLVKMYAIDKKRKKYHGPPPALVDALARGFALEKKLIIGRALRNDKPCAAILVLCHGSGATYQVGWSSQEGRDCAAIYSLLWHVLGILREKNITDFDLGGMNDDSALGVKKFKEGMGGTALVLPGVYS
jgi:hypothetical protein